VADFKLANSVLSDSSALSWLAQQRAEAARIERQLQAMIMQHRHDIRDLGQLLQDERCKVATIEAAWYAARAEVERLREDAARNRWCEEMRADVGWSQVDERWVVNVGERRYSHPDRNAAIDAAMKGGK
jgi:septal ring factor EnvC (AmiA/AmiB activator)